MFWKEFQDVVFVTVTCRIILPCNLKESERNYVSSPKQIDRNKNHQHLKARKLIGLKCGLTQDSWVFCTTQNVGQNSVHNLTRKA